MSISTTIQDEKFGTITETIKDRIDHIITEIEYKDSEGNVIGYWAYGYYDPELPYQG